MTEKLIDCTRCGSNACSEMSNGTVTIWICMGCGFTSNNTIKDDKADMTTKKEFPEREFMDALEYIGYFNGK